MNSDLLTVARDRSRMLGIPFHAQALPAVPADLAPLRGKKILLVDDSPDILAAFLPLLVAATEGKAELLLHREGSPEDLAESVLKLHPSVILLDEYLAGGVRGHDVASLIKKKLPESLCIGFSNAESPRTLFEQEGAKFVYKDVSDPEGTLARVADVLA